MQITWQSKGVNNPELEGNRRCGYSKQTKMRLEIPPHLVIIYEAKMPHCKIYNSKMELNPDLGMLQDATMTWFHVESIN